jgi:integrase
MASFKERVHKKVDKKTGSVVEVRTWQAQIRLKGYKPRSKNFPTEAQAKKWAKSEEIAILTGKVVDPREREKWTIAEVIDWYFENPDSERAFYSDKHFNRLKLLKKELGSFTIQTFTPKVLTKWKKARLKINAPSTVNHYYIALKNALMHHSVLHDYSQTIFQSVKGGGKSGERNRRFSFEETAKLFKTINANCRVKRNELKLTILFSIETACRITEMLKLTWGHVNIEERWVEFLKEDTKTKEFRRIPLTKTAQKILKWLQKNTNKENDKNKRVFHFYNVSEHHLSRQFSIVCKKANIENIRYHDLRHEGCSRLYERFPNLKDREIAHITGHKNLNQLMKYAHLRPSTIVLKLD